MTAVGKRTACSFCKKRKIKCDKNEPCDSCIKYKNPVCEYETAKKRKPKKEVLESQLDVLKSKINKLEAALQGNEGDGALEGQQAQAKPSGEVMMGHGILFDNFRGPNDGGNNWDPLQQSMDQSFNISPASSSNDSGSGSVSTDGSGKHSASTANSSLFSRDSLALDPLTGKSGMDAVFQTVKRKIDDIVRNSAMDPELALLLAGKRFTFNAYEGYSNVHTDPVTGYPKAFGIFGWLAYYKVDSCLRVMWMFVEDKIANAEVEDLDCHVRPALTDDLTIAESVKDTARILGLNIEPDYASEMSLITKIETALPCTDVVWKLIDIFYKLVYPVAPFVDEGVFRAAIAGLIGSDRTDKKPKLNYKSQTDFAILGVLLIALRMSYLTLFSTNEARNESAFTAEDPDPTVQEKKYLLNNPINVECILFSQECLSKFNLFNPTNMWVVQLLLLTYLYRTKGPEFGLEPHCQDNHAILSLLFSACRAMGLNRDPDKSGVDLDEKARNVGRKVWHFLRAQDLMEAYISGSPLIGSEYSYDTKVPVFTPENSNLYDMSTEKTLSNTFSFLCSSGTDVISSFLKKFLDVGLYQDISTICTDLTVIEDVVDYVIASTDLGTFGEPLAPEISDYAQLMRCKMELNTKGSNISIYFHLYNFFDKKREDELAFYFLKRIFTQSFPVLQKLNEVIESENGFTYVVIPSMEVTVQKILLVLLAVAVRLKLYMQKFHGRIPVDTLAALNAFKVSMEEYYNFNLKFVRKFSNRFYSSWFINKTMTYASKFVDDLVVTTECKYLAQIGVLNLNMFADSNKIRDLTAILDAINTGLKDFEISCTQPPQEKNNVDDLWMYLSSISQTVDTNFNTNVLDSMMKDLDNIDPSDLGLN